MTSQILGILMALCAENKSCLTEAIIYNPSTPQRAAILVSAINERERLLNDCGPNDCLQARVAQPMFECLNKRQESPRDIKGKCRDMVWRKFDK